MVGSDRIVVSAGRFGSEGPGSTVSATAVGTPRR
jgi:hypothetical protein